MSNTPLMFQPDGRIEQIVEHPTLRDQFAMAALTGLLADIKGNGQLCRADMIAASAYKIAEAMLAQRAMAQSSKDTSQASEQSEP